MKKYHGFKWACKQMLKGRKVACKACGLYNDTYIKYFCIYKNDEVCVYQHDGYTLKFVQAVLNKKLLKSKKWYLYEGEKE